VDVIRASGRRSPARRFFDRFSVANAMYLMRLVQRRDAALDTANWLTAGLVGLLTIILVLIAVLAARRSANRASARAERQRELRELLQVSASESESQQLLIRHAERIVPGSAAGVLIATRPTTG
jgi:hypothetical protein